MSKEKDLLDLQMKIAANVEERLRTASDEKSSTEWERFRWLIQMTAVGDWVFQWMLLLAIAIYVLLLLLVYKGFCWLLFNVLLVGETRAILLLLLFFFILLFLAGFLTIICVSGKWASKIWVKKIEDRGYRWFITGTMIEEEKYGIKATFRTRDGYRISPSIMSKIRRAEVRYWVGKKGGSRGDGLLWLLEEEIKRYWSKKRDSILNVKETKNK